VLVDKDDRAFVSDFILGDLKSVEFSDQADDVVLENEEYTTEWLQDIELGRRFALDLLGAVLYETWPSNATETETMYLKSNVEVVGTEASPESFTTNIGKLATDDTGNPYPSFSAASHVFEVNVVSRQEAMVHRTGNVTVSGGNLVFSLAVQDGGKPSSDGKFYCDISITLQAKP
jgi:hypothetical protein